MDKLKPCPFCGGKAVIESEADQRCSMWYRVQCRTCWGESGYHRPKSLAIETWNRRFIPHSFSTNNLKELHALLLRMFRGAKAISLYVLQEGSETHEIEMNIGKPETRVKEEHGYYFGCDWRVERKIVTIKDEQVMIIHEE